jgi:hypothetical protein
MRQLSVVAVTVALLAVAAAQSLLIDERASQIALRGLTLALIRGVLLKNNFESAASRSLPR